MKVRCMREWMYISIFFLASAIVGDEWLDSRPVLFTPGGKSPRYPFRRSLGWTTWKIENSCLYRDSNSDPSVIQPADSRYTDWAIGLSFTEDTEHKPVIEVGLCGRSKYLSRLLRKKIKQTRFIRVLEVSARAKEWLLFLKMNIGNTSETSEREPILHGDVTENGGRPQRQTAVNFWNHVPNIQSKFIHESLYSREGDGRVSCQVGQIHEAEHKLALAAP
jgi:hypothetical protein